MGTILSTSGIRRKISEGDGRIIVSTFLVILIQLGLWQKEEWARMKAWARGHI